MYRIGLPGWSNGEESACQCRDMGSVPGLGKFHRQLSRCTTTPEPSLLEPVLHNERGPHKEKLLRHNQKKSLSSNKDPVLPK